jgi:hypothetical protein
MSAETYILFIAPFVFALAGLAIYAMAPRSTRSR